MRTFQAVYAMYQQFVGHSDHHLATCGADAIWLAHTAKLAPAARRRQSAKLLAVARDLPARRFFEFAKSIDQHLLSQPTPHLLQPHGLRPPLDAKLLRQEQPKDLLLRRLDLRGRALKIICAELQTTGRYEPAVLAEVYRQLGASTADSPPARALGQVGQRLCRQTSPAALRQAIDWLQQAGSSVELMDLFDGMHAVAQQVRHAAAQGRAAPPASPRELRDAAEMRPLLQFLAIRDPQFMPQYEEVRGLETALLLWLRQQWWTAHAGDMAHLRCATNLIGLLGRYAAQGDRLLASLPWTPSDKAALQALHTICVEVHRSSIAWAPQAYSLAAQVHLDRLGRKIGRLQRQAAADPAQLAGLLERRGHALATEHQRYEEALQDYDQLLQLRPSAKAHFDRSLLLANLGRLEAAEAAASASAAALADSEAEASGSTVDLLQLYSLRAGLRLELQRPIEALGDLVKSRQLAVGNVYPGRQEDLERAFVQANMQEVVRMQRQPAAIVGLWLELQEARLLLVAGNFADGAAVYDRVLQKCPTAVEARTGLQVAQELQAFQERLPPLEDLAGVPEAQPDADTETIARMQAAQRGGAPLTQG